MFGTLPDDDGHECTIGPPGCPTCRAYERSIEEERIRQEALARAARFEIPCPRGFIRAKFPGWCCGCGSRILDGVPIKHCEHGWHCSGCNGEPSGDTGDVYDDFIDESDYLAPGDIFGDQS